jgi:hypothetical protein
LAAIALTEPVASTAARSWPARDAIVGAVGIFLQWFTPPEGLGLIMAGLAILGVRTGGSYAGSVRK